VYRANWRNKCVAVKRINFNVQDENVEREFKQLSRASHINIVFLHGLSIHDGVHYFIMEYADGGSLFSFLYTEQPKREYTLNHVISWALQAARVRIKNWVLEELLISYYFVRVLIIYIQWLPIVWFIATLSHTTCCCMTIADASNYVTSELYDTWVVWWPGIVVLPPIWHQRYAT